MLKASTFLRRFLENWYGKISDKRKSILKWDCFEKEFFYKKHFEKFEQIKKFSKKILYFTAASQQRL